MPTRVKELAKVMDMPAKHGACNTCGDKPKGTVSAETLWVRSQAAGRGTWGPR